MPRRKPEGDTIVPSVTTDAGIAAGVTHDPLENVRLLLEKLGQPRRHLAILLGAGASRVAGIPDLSEMGTAVERDLDEGTRPAYQRLMAGRNLETLLSYLRLARTLLADATSPFDGLTAASAAELDRAVTRSIAGIVGSTAGTSDPHDRLASWLGRSLRPSPVEVFTTNYDLLIERALERRGVPYFDGFVGTFRGEFRPDLIEPDEAPERSRLPSGWVRLWKLHGSVSWVIDEPTRSIQRLGVAANAEPADVLAIYPSAEKYEESRRLPFLALIDRLRRALATPESTTVAAGYSFGDAHINELIFDAVERYQRSEVIALFHSEIPQPVIDRAQRYANFTVYGAREAVFGGTRGSYAAGSAGAGWDGSRVTVGDFTALAQLLTQAESNPELEPSAG